MKLGEIISKGLERFHLKRMKRTVPIAVFKAEEWKPIVKHALLMGWIKPPKRKKKLKAIPRAKYMRKYRQGFRARRDRRRS